jgi:uncharacterized repeat protein (TIGR01451 family)
MQFMWGALFLFISTTGFSANAATVDLSVVSNVAATTTYTPGTTGTNYSFTVKNNSAVTDVTGVNLTGLTVPSGVTWSWTCTAVTGAVCNTTSGSGAMTLTVDLNAGKTVTIATTSVSYSPGMTGPVAYSVSATLSGVANNDPDTANNTGTDSRARSAEGALSIVKAGSTTATSYTPGTTTTATADKYSFVVSNGGPSDLQGIVVNGDSLPTGMQSMSWTCSASTGSSCSASSGTGAMDLTLDLDSGDSATITGTAVYKSSATEAPMTYAMAISPASGDTDTSPPGNDSVTDSRTRDAKGALSVARAASTTATSYIPGTTTTATADKYSFVVSNGGPSDLQGIVVNGDSLPAGMQSMSWTCSASTGSSCSASSGTGAMDLTLDLDSGDSATITGTAVYKSSAAEDPMIYAVVISPAAGDTDTSAGNDTATDSRTRDVQGDLGVTSTGTATTYTPGVTTTATADKYIYTVTNTGPSDLSNITITGSTLPAGMSAFSWTCARAAGANATTSCGIANGTGAPSLTANIDEGDSIVLTATATYRSSAIESPMTYSIIVAVATGDTDTSSGNNSATDSRSLSRVVDLKIVKSNGVNALNPQQAYSYTLTVTNDGPSDLGGLPGEKGGLITDDINDLKLAGKPGTCANAALPCWQICPGDGGNQGNHTVALCPLTVVNGSGDISSSTFESGIKLVAGSSTEVLVHVALKSGVNDNVSNTASVSLPLVTTSGVISDPVSSNNSSTDTDTIAIGTDIVVSKTDNVTSAIPGTSHSYTVTVENRGFVGANGISLIDTMPVFSGSTSAGFSSGSISWQCVADAGACCNSGTANCGTSGATSPVTSDSLNVSVDIPAQSKVVFTLSGLIDPQASGTLNNTATAALPAGVTETSPGDETDSDADTVLVPNADLAIGKIAGSPVAVANHFDIQYTIVVENLGPSFVAGAAVKDSLSSDFDLSTVSWNCSVTGGSGSSACVTASGSGAALNTTVDLDPGAIATVVLTVSTVDFPAGIVSNTATVTAPVAVNDPVVTNNSATANVTLTGEADLQITKSDGLITVTPGEPLTYTVQITNAGPDHVFGATVQDILPVQLEKASWTCDASTPIPGDLTYIESQIQNIDLEGAVAVVSSPDGRSVYVAASQNGTLLSYEREVVPNSQFGKLLLLEVEQDGVDDTSDTGGVVSGLANAADIAISHDGRHVYVVGAATDPALASVAMFSRSTVSGAADFGRLTYSGIIATQTNASSVVVSPDGKNLYVAAGDSIDSFERDAVTGVLTALETVANASIPGGLTDMVFDPEGKQLYVLANGEVVVMNRVTDTNSPDFGRISFASTTAHADMTGAAAIAISADGNNIYVAADNAATGALIALSRNNNTGALTYLTTYQDSTAAVPTGSMSGASGVAVADDGEHVMLIAGIGNSLLEFRRVAATGLLNFQEYLEDGQPPPPATPVNGLDGASAITVTADGHHILVAAGNDKSVSVFERRSPDPLFSFIEIEQWNVDDPGDSAAIVPSLRGASGVSVSPDGAHVYAVSLGDNALSVFARDPGKGATEDTRGGNLDFMEAHYDGVGAVTGIQDAAFVLVSPDGQFVYVSSTNANSLAVFARDNNDTSASYGKLTFLESHVDGVAGADGLSGASGMAMDPNSRHLYVAARYEAAVGIYERDIATGALSYIGKVTNGINGVQGLLGAFDVDISTDGKHIVVAGSENDSLVVLSRESNFASSDFGLLSFLQMLNIGVGDRPMDVVISPEDSHVYVAAANSNSLSVFRRDMDSASVSYGKLTLQAQYQDGADGVGGLRGARAVAISADGKRVYVGGEFDGAVAIFDRNKNDTSASFGNLIYQDKRQDGIAGVEGLAGVRSLAMSPDSRHLYTAALGDNAVAAFVRGLGSSCTAAGAGDVHDVIDVGVGGVVTYTINADVRADALVGTLVNTATATLPVGINDATSVNGINTAIDSDTVLAPRADLVIEKTNSRISSVSGQDVSYRITVQNNGPSNAANGIPAAVTVEDILSSNSNIETGSVSWACEAIGSGRLSLLESHIQGAGGLTSGLGGATSVTVGADPDGVGGPLTEYVYATGVLDNALAVFGRDSVSGMLSLNQTIANGDVLGGATVQGLQGAHDVVVSADGRFIYVASQVDDAVAVFSAADNGSGQLQLSFLGAVSDAGLDQASPTPNTIDGLNQAVALVLSADNKHLYVVGANDNAVAVFERNVVTGLLTFVEALFDGVNGISGLDGPVDVISTPVTGVSDGGQVYVVGANSASIAVFQRNAITGALTFSEVHDQSSSGYDLSGANGLSLAANGEQLYLVAGLSHSVSAFSRNSDNASGSYGSLTPLQHLSDATGTPGLVGAEAVQVSPDGFQVYVASYTSDAIVYFNRDDLDGSLNFIGAISDGVSGVDGLDGVTALAFSADGRHLYSAATNDQAIDVFTRVADSSCPSSGTGDINVPVNIGAGGSLVFTVNATISTNASGNLVNTATLYAPIDSNPGNNSSTDQDVIETTADLSITKSDGLAEYDGLAGAAAAVIHTSVMGSYIYVAGHDESAIALLSREDDNAAPDYGELTFLERYKNGENGIDGLAGVEDLVLSPDGLNLYAVGGIGNSIAVFARDDADGQLTFVERKIQGELGVTGLSGPSSVAISPDGNHVYVTGRNTSTVVVFSRQNGQPSDAGFGSLSYVQTIQNGLDSVSGIAGPTDVKLSPDGKHVYVLGGSENAIAVFARNPNSGSSSFGQLSFVASYTEVSGFGGLVTPKSLLISADGLFVYAASPGSDSVTVMARNATDGSLSFLEFWQNGSSGVAGLNGAGDLVLSADEDYLYVAGSEEDAIAIFDRNATTGLISFAGNIRNGDSTAVAGVSVQGLMGVSSVLVSADNRHLYVTAALDNALSGLNRDTATGDLTYMESIVDGLGGVAPGDPVNYIIVVGNNGPSDVSGARVVDHFPSEFQSVSWTCSATGGAGCVPSGTGSVDTLVNIPAGDSVIFTAGGLVRADVSGRLINTATVEAPSGVSDSNQNNNSATDSNTVLTPTADVYIEKTNGLTEVVPGQSVTYTITVGNTGPSYAAGARVQDLVPEAISEVSWSCAATPEPGLLAAVSTYTTDLDSYVDTVISPDGMFLYAIGPQSGIGAVAVYQRDPRSGQLTYIRSYPDSTPGLDGLAGVADVVMSADGSYLYTAGNIDDAVAVFAVNKATGELNFVEWHQDAVNGVNGLGGVKALTISPDGRHLYAAGFDDDGIAIFSRDSASGQLTFVDALLQGQAGADGLNGATALVFGPDGSYLYVAGKDNDGLAILKRNSLDGLLAYQNTIQNWQILEDVLTQPVALAMHPQGSQLFVSSFGSDAVAVFDIDADTGALSYQSAAIRGIGGVTSLDGPVGLALTADASELYVSASISSAVSMFRFESGSLTQRVVYGTGANAGLAGVSALLLSSDDEHIYAGGSAGSSLVVMDRKAGSRCSSSGTGNLSDIADLSVGGTATYTVTGEVNSGATGQLVNFANIVLNASIQEASQTNNQSVDSDPIVGHVDLEISKDDGITEVFAGEALTYNLQIGNLGVSDAVGVSVADPLPVFPAINAGFKTGTASMQCSDFAPLSFRQEFSFANNADLAGSAWSAMSADGRFVYSTAAQSGKLLVWKRELSGAAAGDLSLVQTIAEADVLAGGVVSGMGGIAGLTISRNQKHLYVVSSVDNRLLVFSRDAVTGLLDWVAAYADGQDNVVGMEGPVSVTVSPDDSFVYVAAELPSAVVDSGAVVVFQRDAATGVLTFVERLRDGFGSIAPDSNVIVDPRQMLISPDGNYMYVNGSGSDAVALFSRNVSTGRLTYVSAVREGDIQGALTVSGLGFVYAMAMSSNGEYLYVTGLGGDAVAVFDRDAGTGELTFLKAYVQGADGGSAIDGASALVLSAQGTYLYVTGLNSNAVSVFKRDWDSGLLRFQYSFNNGSGGASQVLEPISLLTSPDAAHLYMLGRNPGSLVSFDIEQEALCMDDTSIGDVMSWTVDMAKQSQTGLTVSATVHPSARGIITNTALINPPTGIIDGILINNAGTDSDTRIIAKSDIAITKVGPDVPVPAGTDYEYVLEVTNAGPSDALGATVVDNIPTALPGADWTCSATAGSSCSATGVGDINDTVTVLVGGKLTYTITAHSAANGFADVSNTAYLIKEPGAVDPDESNNTDTIVTQFSELADLSIIKSSIEPIVVPGRHSVFTLVVENAGPSDARIVNIADAMPVEYSSVTWSCHAMGTAVCSGSSTGLGDLNAIGAIPVGSQLRFFIDGVLDPLLTANQVTNTGVVQIQGVGTDPDAANNTSTYDVPVQFQADMAIVKTDPVDPVVIDASNSSALIYKLTVENFGPSIAWNVRVQDVWPDSVTYNNTPGCISSTPGSGIVIDCVLGDMLPGDSRTFQLNGNVSQGTTGILVNTASVESDSVDPYPGNNSTVEETTLIDTGAVDLMVTKTNGVSALVPGQPVIYSIVVRNIGTADSGNVTVSDVIPAQLQTVNWICSATPGSSCQAGGSGDIADSASLLAGGVIVYTVTATVDPALDPDGGIVITNSITVNSAGDVNTSNNSATDADPVVRELFHENFEL